MRRLFAFVFDTDFYNRHWKPSNHLEVHGLELKTKGCLPLSIHLMCSQLIPGGYYGYKSVLMNKS